MKLKKLNIINKNGDNLGEKGYYGGSKYKGKPNVKYIITVLLLVCSMGAKADVNLIIHSMSKHFKSSDDTTQYNETNYALGIELIQTSSSHGIIAGIYKDSFNTTAKYFGGLYLPGRFKYVDIGLLYGVARSPSYNSGDILLAVLPYIAIKTKILGINLLYRPKLNNDAPATLGIQIKVKLDPFIE